MTITSERHRQGFSLIELLAAIGIIALLLAILLPVVNRVRSAARSTRCLANLQQWGHAYQMYLSANDNRSISEVDGAAQLRWWEILGRYNNDIRISLLCPDARELPSNGPIPDGDKAWVAYGSAVNAWRTANKFSHDRNVGDDYIGSYCINLWTFHHRTPNMQQLYIHFPLRHPDRIPLLGDSIMPWAVPTTRDRVPANLSNPELDASGGIGGYCIDRHQLATNIVFLDGHAEHVPLATLWQLKWSENSTPQSVTVPRQ